MNESPPNPATATETPAPPNPPAGTRWWAWPQRIILLAFGVVLPLVCFFFSWQGLHRIESLWQSGQLDVYAELLLDWKPSLAFYPFLLYSMVSFALIVCRPERFAQRSVLRAGVYTGVLLTVHYLLVLAAAADLEKVPFDAVVVLIAAGCFLFIGWLGRRSGQEIAGAIALVIVVLSVIPPICFFILIFSTPLALTVYSAAAVRLVVNRPSRRFQFSLVWLLGLIAWLSAYLGAWRLSVQLMLEEYAKLPTEAPDCYVATAAARGHRRWVRTDACRSAAGYIYQANDQMRRLKAFELVLSQWSPRLHRMCRGVYDRLGPRAAAMLVYPLLADAAYLALKPVEWFALAALRCLVPDADCCLARFYPPYFFHGGPRSVVAD